VRVNGRRPPRQVEIVTCENPLERFVPPLMRFLERAFGDCWPGRPDSPQTRLEWVRRATDAEAAAVVEMSTGQPPCLTCASGSVPEDLTEVLGPLVRETVANRRAVLGYVAEWIGPAQDGCVLSVPLTHDSRDRTSSLVLVQPAASLLKMGEPLAALLRGAWHVEGLEDPAHAQIEVLTALRDCFGRLPLQVYQHCFDTYRRVLDGLVMAFEPVVNLAEDERLIGIQSYEALARRDQDAQQAPFTVLDLAYQWGDQFVIERDRTLAVKAVHAYARAHEDGPFAGNKPPGLSINVAVRSLLSDGYADALGRALQEAGLGHGLVTLEISERDPIKPEPDEKWLPNPMAYFRSRLADLASRLQVAFAVDDFGVDHASLERISELGLTQIKVDRAILGHPRALEELQLVVDIAHDALRRGIDPAARDVVVEGFDGTSEVTLKQIFGLSIRHIQGYITEQPAQPRLRTLDDGVRRRIASMVRGAP
jgi:EAL domain-containing protein (putative c-di-GMP-specific phosphodiesterase class I)